MGHLENESKVGQMLRYLSGDIGIAFKHDLEKLYDYEEIIEDETTLEKIKPIGKECAEWHWMIVKYAPDPVMTRKFISIIQYCYEYQIRPSQLNAWKKLMRIYLPEQFLQKMGAFTQVPQLAIMDDGHEDRLKDMRKKMKDSQDVNW